MNYLKLTSCLLPFMFLLLSAPLTLGGCANKAKVIRIGATQFETESLIAINKIDEFRRKELETTALSSKEASDFFVKSVKKSTKPITLETLRILSDPLGKQMPQSEAEWLQATSYRLRLLAASYHDARRDCDRLGDTVSSFHLGEGAAAVDHQLWIVDRHRPRA